MNEYNIGDIIFVENYKYKDGSNGTNHSFVIIDESQAVDIDYFGFLISSKIEKESYPYNEKLAKNEENNLRKNSIVKCDDLIRISEEKVKFKIGTVTEDDLNRFLNTYIKYIEEN